MWQIKLKRQLISTFFDTDYIFFIIVFHVILYIIIALLAYGSVGTSSDVVNAIKSTFTIEIVIYLLIESFILLTNFVKEYRIFNLKEKISDTEDEISKMKNDLQNMRIQLNSIPNTDSIPYTDSMASYTIIGENYY